MVAMGADRLTSPSDSVLRLMRIAHARFLSDTTQCPMVTSKSVCRTTVSDRGSGPPGFHWDSLNVANNKTAAICMF